MPPTFTSYARLDDHLEEHKGPRQCKNCGQVIHSPLMMLAFLVQILMTSCERDDYLG